MVPGSEGLQAALPLQEAEISTGMDCEGCDGQKPGADPELVLKCPLLVTSHNH